MYKPRFCIGQFNSSRLRDGNGKAVDRRLSDRAMIHLLEAGIEINIDYLRENSGTPLLSEAKCITTGELLYYKRVILPGQEDDDWADFPTILTLGYFDCEDGVMARIAELRFKFREYAVPDLRYQEDGAGNWLYHVRIRRGNGAIQDISKELDRRGYYTKVFSR